MDSSQVPPWCQWNAGASSVLVIAPHGGRRRSTSMPVRSRKVNDLHTADFAFQLAKRLDASFIINQSVDRNELDLNRISQVTQRATWFLDVIDRLLAAALERHATALVLFVHGWNVTQARCDVGIGASIADEDASIEGNDRATVSETFLRQRLRVFRQLCEARGIRTTYGERYPASHPNNVLQIFRRSTPSTKAESRRISDWVAAGRVEAVQLELGIALRWPGKMRTSFVVALGDAFGRPSPSPPSSTRTLRRSTPLRPPASLQCFDPLNGIGVSAGIAVEGNKLLRGRLLLFLGGQRVALFVGEDRQPHRLVSGGPEFHGREHRFQLSFDGTLLSVDDGHLYLDLENAFAVSKLVEAQLDLSFDAFNGSRYGEVRGRLRLEGQTWTFDCQGFADAFARPSTPLRPSHSALSACFGAELGVQVRTGERRGGACGTVTQIFCGERRKADLHVLSVELDHDGYSPRRITASLDAKNELVAEPLNRMSIFRPGAGHDAARVTFGVARVRLDERVGFGFYEHARPLRSNAT